MYTYQFAASFVVRSVFLIAFLIVSQPSLAQPEVLPGGLWGPLNGEDEDEIEIEADGVNQPGTLPGGLWGPMNGEDEDEIEIEADGYKQHGSTELEALALYAMLHELCQRGTTDDHSDSFPCATLLAPGHDVVGTLGNDRGDDVDVFQIVLGGTDLWRLDVAAAGDVEIVTALYDQKGQRLEWAESSAGDSRIVRMLRPGIYFVKVASARGAEGNYALGVDASPW
ncbi:MAG: hypothetical protein GY719_39265 [bacterium]|nr:hypothetical protein [bacterium]